MLGGLRRPGTGRIDQCTRGHDVAVAAGAERQLPELRGAVGAYEPRAGADDGAALSRVDCIEHHETRIIHPAVGIDETPAEFTLERLAKRTMGEIDHLRGGQDFAPSEMVINE